MNWFKRWLTRWLMDSGSESKPSTPPPIPTSVPPCQKCGRAVEARIQILDEQGLWLRHCDTCATLSVLMTWYRIARGTHALIDMQTVEAVSLSDLKRRVMAVRRDRE